MKLSFKGTIRDCRVTNRSGEDTEQIALIEISYTARDSDGKFPAWFQITVPFSGKAEDLIGKQITIQTDH